MASHTSERLDSAALCVLNSATHQEDTHPLLDAVEAHGDANYNELISELRSYDALMGLSPLRENIVAWYPIPQDARVLELGAGLGAVTGRLVRNAREMVAVCEAADEAHVLAARFKTYAQLQVIAGAWNEVRPQLKGSFDFIFVHNLLAWGGAELLGSLKDLLAAQGRILACAPNRMNYRELCQVRVGSVGPFDVHGREADDKLITRSEVLDLIKHAGFAGTRLYYPYPDRFFCRAIYTDERLPAASELTSFADPLGKGRCLSIHEEDFIRACAQEGVFGEFVSDFVCELSCDSLPEDQLAYAKISGARRPELAIATTISTHHKVRKLALYPEGVAHLEHIARAYKELTQNHASSFAINKAHFDGTTLELEYLSGKTLDTELIEFMQSGKKTEALALLQEYKRRIEAVKTIPFELSDEFLEVFGRLSQKKDFERYLQTASHGVTDIDPILSNVVLEDSTWTLIDYEWTFEFPIPLKYLLWRALTLLLRSKYVQTLEQDYAFWELFDIDETDRRIFFEMECSLQVYLSNDAESVDELLRELAPEPYTIVGLVLENSALKAERTQEKTETSPKGTRKGLKTMLSQLFKRD